MNDENTALLRRKERTWPARTAITLTGTEENVAPFRRSRIGQAMGYGPRSTRKTGAHRTPAKRGLMLPADPIPAAGFKVISGKRSPPDDGRKYQVQFRNGYVDRKHEYTAGQLVWKHDGGCWDVVAVKGDK